MTQITRMDAVIAHIRAIREIRGSANLLKTLLPHGYPRLLATWGINEAFPRDTSAARNLRHSSDESVQICGARQAASYWTRSRPTWATLRTLNITSQRRACGRLCARWV